MIKKYNSLNKLLKDNNLCKETVVMVDHHLMAKDNNTEEYVVCHFVYDDKEYILDDCKRYNNVSEPTSIMMRLILRG
jgi:hypothetical protein